MKGGCDVATTVGRRRAGPGRSAGGRAGGGRGTAVEIDGLKSTAPADWKKEEPTEIQMQFRKYQFTLPEGRRATRTTPT